ncbi:hypothetical protein OG515_29885 [Streptomyces melanogenes]|uniref:Xaa-Pro dipeptidyl-peptidase C-terminal domain-containing protein n=1 Tax=Streptomyces melanogenes TaxID=67326 RepID=A0ABZ1XRA5_9ACTN|nr:CocE/NonD family hydrolase C-terminal non-catalytic domain-containing protein [Streptomyces melanogenes]
MKAAPAAAAARVSFHDIPGSGGITLKGNVFTPAGAKAGERYPLIVFPGSWASPQIEYIAQAQKLADAGYTVVSYASRGFWLSGGEIEVAGPKDTAEASGLLGLPNDVWTDAQRWFGRYLKGESNGIDQEQPVKLKSRTDGSYEGYPSWQAVGAAEEKLPLGGSKRIFANVDSGADGGILLLSNILDQFTKLPPMASIPLLPRAFAAVWQSERYDTPRRIRGTAALHTTVTPTKESGTLVAYLYDVGPLGLGKLVSNAPYTFHGRTPGRPFAVDLELFSTSYDVPAGHRPALVVDTVDPLYIEHNPTGAQLTFSSPASDPSYLTVPLREE